LAKKKKIDTKDIQRISKIKWKYTQRKIVNTVLILILIAIIVGAGYYVYAKLNLGNKTVPSDVAATVNGEPITLADLDKKYSTVPEQYRTMISKAQFLEQMIEEKMLLIQAKKDNIAASDEEVNATISRLLTQYKLTDEQLKTELQAQGMSYDDFVQYYRNELIIAKLLNNSVKSENVTDAEIEAYYNQNKEQFNIPESINASHIIICYNESIRCVSNLTKDEAFRKISDIKLMLKQGKSFADLAKQYSEDGSAALGGSLGYFAKGEMDSSFEKAAFSLKVGEVSDIVETPFGYHLIMVTGIRPATNLTIANVSSEIRDTLQAQLQQASFNTYVSKLRNESDIKIYLNESS
jgi:parvulin-like peptidyl-prolyl isomerase